MTELYQVKFELRELKVVAEYFNLDTTLKLN